MTDSRLAGLRIDRSGPVILAALPERTTVARGDLVLVELETGLTLARVALAPDEIAYVTPSATPRRVRAVGAASPEVARAIEQRDAVALGEAQGIVGSAVSIRRTTWSPDYARLTVTLASGPPPGVDALRDRLASHFRAEIRLDWQAAAEAATPD